MRLQLRGGGVAHIMTRAATGNFFINGAFMLHGLTNDGEVFGQTSLSAILARSRANFSGCKDKTVRLDCLHA